MLMNRMRYDDPRDLLCEMNDVIDETQRGNVNPQEI